MSTTVRAAQCHARRTRRAARLLLSAWIITTLTPATVVRAEPPQGEVVAGSCMALDWCPESAKLTGRYQTNGHFGYAMALRENLLAVSESTETIDTGAVHVFQWDGSAWAAPAGWVLSELTGGYFGASVAMGEGRLIVGGTRGPCCGSAYVYRQDAGQWTLEARLTASDPQDYSSYGYSVAIDGDVALVGAYTSAVSSVYAYRYEQGAWQETQRIQAPSLQPETEFGFQIALRGNVAIISEPAFSRGTSSHNGAAYIYRFDGTIWALEQELTPPPSAVVTYWFGSAAALDGTRAIVEGWRASCEGGGWWSECGEIDVYRFNGTTWEIEATLEDATPPRSDSFFGSLALNGEWIAVGMPWADGENGAVQVFHFDGSTWSFWGEAARPGCPNCYSSYHYGRAVAVGLGQFIVGAPGGASAVYTHNLLEVAPDCDCDGKSDACEIINDRQVDCNHNLLSDECDVESGSSPDCNGNAVPDECDIESSCVSADCNSNARPDECDVSLGASEDCNANGLPDECEDFLVPEDQRITAPQPNYSDYFGSSVALQSDVAVVGAPYADTAGGSAAGMVVVYRSHQSAWSQEAVLTASDGDVEDFFGIAVAVDRQSILVGAFGDECISTTAKEDDCGSAYVFGFDSSTGQWREEAKLLAVATPAGSDFAQSVSLSRNVALIGAPANSSESNEPGRAFVFRKVANQWIPEQTLTASEVNANAGFGSAVAVDENRAVIGAPYESCAAGPYCGAAYIFHFTNGVWMQEARMTSPAQSAYEQFGRAVSLRDDVAIVATWQEAHIYRFDSVASLWRPEAGMWPSDLPPGRFVILALASDDDAFIISGRSAGCASAFGAAYFFSFDRDTSSWAELAKPISSNRTAARGFGGAVALRGDVALVGANAENCPAGPGCGAAYFFSRLSDRDCDDNRIPDECGIAPCTGAPACVDCNANRIPDRCDIVGNTSIDCNSNAIPDECEEPTCPPVHGACCDLLSGSCADDLLAGACSGTRQAWTADAICGDVVCDAIGACCDLLSGNCAGDILASACSGSHQVWTKAATCDDVVCEAATGACCDHDPFGACTDGVTRAACDCPTCEWVKLVSCSELDCPHTAIPTVGEWGLVVLSLLLLIGAKLAFRRREVRFLSRT